MLAKQDHFTLRVSQFERECAQIRRSTTGRREIVFLGDSLVAMCPGMAEWINRGIQGDSLERAEFNVFDRIGTSRLHPHPHAIVVSIGSDDLRGASDSVSKQLVNFGYLFSNLGQLYPGVPLAVVSLLPAGGAWRHLNSQILELNQGLAELAAAQGVAFWGLHERFYDTRTQAIRAGCATRDGRRLSRRGYSELIQALRERAGEFRGSSLESIDWAKQIDRRRLGQSIVNAYGKGCWDNRQGASTEAELIENHLLPEIDFLCRYVETNSEVFGSLYIGSRAKFVAKNKHLLGKDASLEAVLERDRSLWLGELNSNTSADGIRARLETSFLNLKRQVPSGSPRNLRLLFVGDCLLEDVELLLNGSLVRQGLLADVDFVVSKNPVEQVRQVKELSGNAYDGVVYSPFTWEFDQEFRALLQPALRSRRSLERDIESIWRRTRAMIGLLASSFDCNVYVHNTGAIVRSATGLVRKVKSILTYRQRDFARRDLSGRIGRLVEELNASSFQHLFLIDELGVVKDLRDDLSLGQFLYYSGAIHPTPLSCEVAQQLSSLVSAAARLVDKKVVVCDLDNTLWDGVIGEGVGVRHHRERQNTLQLLKQRGVVLAINSKNDPANVTWKGGFLSEGDFVASEISWNPKALGMRRLQEALNLKVKDFVFIDDRPDERQMAVQEHPHLTAMDPTSEHTWALFKAWAALLGNQEGDRTRMYKERAERERVLGSSADGAENIAAELFAKLQPKVELGPARAGELKRVHELINRTNQWNLGGTRCSFREVQGWHESSRHLVYAARMSDRFGDMGLVCCCVAEVQAQSLDVLVFVLSCRVFGYGVETVLLERLKQEARRRFGAPNVRGVYVETPHNKPCRAMYARHGFTEVGGAWVYQGGSSEAPSPIWLQSEAT